MHRGSISSPPERNCLLIVGAGLLAEGVMQQLLHRCNNTDFILVSRTAETLEATTNLLRYVQSQWELNSTIEYVVADLANVDRMAEVIQAAQPDVILNATTFFPWWKIANLPDDLAAKADSIGPGIWCAFDALPPLLLADAIQKAGTNSVYVNACYPDATNRFLANHAAPPVVGIGNLANLIPGFRLAFAEHFQVPSAKLKFALVCHHYVSLNAPVENLEGNLPYVLEVTYEDQRHTFSGENWPFKYFRSNYPRTRGKAGQSVTASSAAVLIYSLLNELEIDFHAPGPAGLVGGYPITIGPQRRISVRLPKSISSKEADRINADGQTFDGIEFAEPGKLRATHKARAFFEDITDFELPTVTPTNVWDVAKEAATRMNFKYGIGISI